MNKKQIVTSLNKIADLLDNTGLYKEANTVTKIMSRLAMDENDEYNMEDYGMCPDCGEYIGDDENCEDCGWTLHDNENMEDFDMGPEEEPFDFSSLEDEDDMYGDDMKGYMDKDTDF